MALPHGTTTDLKYHQGTSELKYGIEDRQDYLGMPANRSVEWRFIANYVMEAIKHLFKLDTDDPHVCRDAKLFYDAASLTIRHLREMGRCCKTTNLNWAHLFRRFMSKGGFEHQDLASIVAEFHDLLFHPVDPEAEADADVDIHAKARSIGEVCMYLEATDDECNYPVCLCVAGED
jgi:hypothetical protein